MGGAAVLRQVRSKLNRFGSYRLPFYHYAFFSKPVILCLKLAGNLFQHEHGGATQPDSALLVKRTLQNRNRLAAGICLALILVSLNYQPPPNGHDYAVSPFSRLDNAAIAWESPPPEPESSRSLSEYSQPASGRGSATLKHEEEPETDPKPNHDRTRNETGVSATDSASGNRYAYGHCTWYVYNLRAQANDPIPGNWGNATDWGASATRDGYIVNQTPAVGSIAWRRGGWGHVAYVTEVNHDRIHVKEMHGFKANGIPAEAKYHISAFDGYIH